MIYLIITGIYAFIGLVHWLLVPIDEEQQLWITRAPQTPWGLFRALFFILTVVLWPTLYKKIRRM